MARRKAQGPGGRMGGRCHSGSRGARRIQRCKRDCQLETNAGDNDNDWERIPAEAASRGTMAGRQAGQDKTVEGRKGSRLLPGCRQPQQNLRLAAAPATASAWAGLVPSVHVPPWRVGFAIFSLLDGPAKLLVARRFTTVECPRNTPPAPPSKTSRKDGICSTHSRDSRPGRLLTFI